ncbi:MAG: DUF2117 domain-containing protein [Methanobacteriaceae archaeon]|nr:DUF2117 domain-containing protein [Methanobacteriaceae archaeon]
MNIGVVVHGPGIIDSGYAIKILKILDDFGNVTSILGGTMGRTAVIDANIENIIDIKRKRLPSQSVNYLSKTNDLIVLLNYGKSNTTGYAFGYKVYNNALNGCLSLQIERPGQDDGKIIVWEKESYELAVKLSEILNMDILNKDEVINFIENQTGFHEENNIIHRKIAGVSSGENIMVNGVVIGHAIDDNLTIITDHDKIIDIRGGVIKGHGIEKLGTVDIKTAIVKTGLLRKSKDVKPRIIKTNNIQGKLTAIFLDHIAEDIYQYNDCNVLVSIGDDTTLVASDILYRFNIPIIGITDGDLDKVVEVGFKMDESVIIQVDSGFDDIVGGLVYDKLFSNGKKININSISELKDKILSIIDGESINYNIK